MDELNANPPPMIVDPHRPQIETIELFRMYLQGHPVVCRNRDPFQMLFGANLVGPPGCGKTHILAAFARRMKEYLDSKLEAYRAMVAQFVSREYVVYQEAIARVPNPSAPTSVWKIEGDAASDEAGLLDHLKLGKAGEGSLEKRSSLAQMSRLMTGKLVEQKDPAALFLGKLGQFTAALSRLQYQPPDLLYVDFDTLWELCRGESATRDQALEAIVRAKVVFLDDVHPKGDAERVQIVLHVIEGRYAAGRMGTFMTTNLTTEELAGKDANLASRLQSRCSEMFYEVDFKGCDDWRTKVKRRRITLAKEHLDEQIGRGGAPGPVGSPPTTT